MCKPRPEIHKIGLPIRIVMKKLMTKHKRLAYKKKPNLEITTSGAYVVEKKTELSFLILKFTGKINERSEMAIKLN